MTQEATKVQDVEIVRAGEQIIIPEGMSLQDAEKWIQKKAKEEEHPFNIYEVVDAFPLEGAYAFQQVLKEKYGFVPSAESRNWFDNTTPTFIGLDVAPGKTVQLVWGPLTIPKVAGRIQPGIAWKDNRLQFVIRGDSRKKHQAEIAELARLTREYVKTKSIYRGQAIRVKFAESEEDFNPLDCPKFMDVSGVRADELIFPETLQRIVQTSLFTLIERTAECKELGIPLKRGILLEGTYGCGKTMTANVTAKKCVDNGWTFLYLDSVAQLPIAIEFARQYQPTVIFAEDIDRVMAGQNRDAMMDTVLNTIDGIGSKNSEIVVVLTTNDVAKINKAMLRPGRLDAVISVTPPDASAVVRLIGLYSRGLLDKDDNYDRVGALLAGNIPAVVREVVERSKLAAVSRRAPNEPFLLKAEDLETAAEGMLGHLSLMKGTEPDNRTQIEKLVQLFAEKVGPALAKFEADARQRNLDLRLPPRNGKLPSVSEE